MLAPLVAARPGLRVPGAWDGFELAVRAILGQQITVSAATRCSASWSPAHGEPLPAAMADGEGLTPSVSDAREHRSRADLAALGMPERAGDGADLAGAASPPIPQFFGRGASLDEAIAKLRALPGIGEWTAQYIAMRELREPDAFPAADIGLMRAMAARRPASVACRAAEARRTLAAVARLRGAASVGCGHSASCPDRKNPMSAKPPETFTLDRLRTPIGIALLVTDVDGALRALDWEDHEPRMRELLRLQYGTAILEEAPAPRDIRAALSRYFAGDLASLAAIKWRVAGTPSSARSGPRCRPFPRAPP